MNDNVLRESFIRADAERFSRLELREANEWTPSAEFECAMKKLISSIGAPRRAAGFALKRAAVIFAALLAVLGSAMTVDAIREPIVRFFSGEPEDVSRREGIAEGTVSSGAAYVCDVVLPEDGKAVVYDPEILFFADENGSVSFKSAERIKNRIIFTPAGESDFSFLAVILRTSKGENFVGMNAVRAPDGSYTYETELFCGVNADDPEKYSAEEIKTLLEERGGKFSKNKDYYFVVLAKRFDAPGKDDDN